MRRPYFAVIALLAVIQAAALSAAAPKTESPRLLAELEWPGRTPPNSVAFSPDGKAVVTTSSDRVVRFWDAKGGKALKVIKNPHEVNRGQHQWGQVHLAIFSPDGKTVATASDDDSIRLWDAATGEKKGIIRSERRAIGSAGSLAFSPDGKTIATGEREVRLWNVADFKEKSESCVPDGNCPVVGFDTKGKALALGTGRSSAENRYDTVFVHDALTGKTLLTLKGHDKEVAVRMFCPDGKTVITAARDGTVRTWSLATGKQLTCLTLKRVRICDIAVSADGQTLAVGYKQMQENGSDSHPEIAAVKLFDVKSGREFLALEGKTNPIGPLAFSPDGKTLAVGLLRQPVVQLWKLPAKPKK